jgi:tetratricopeptide (TPR) repeat protein
MDKYTLLNLINNPQNISENDIENLEEVALQHPYCQVVHILTAKFAHDQASMLANQKIKKAACYAYNRNILRKLIIDKPQLAFQITEEKNNAVITSPIEKVEEIKPEPSLVINQLKEVTPVLPKEDLMEIDLVEEEADETRSFFEMIEDESFNPSISEVIAEPIIETQPTDNPTFTENFSLSSADDFNLTSLESGQSSYFTEIKPSDNQSDAFFEDIDNQEVIPVLEEHPVYESINEGKALGLYYDGKVQESISMYQQLMEMYPQKRDYYEIQLKELLGNKIYLYNVDIPSHPQEIKEEAKGEDVVNVDHTTEIENNTQVSDNQDLVDSPLNDLKEVFPEDSNVEIINPSDNLVIDENASFFEPIDYELPLQFYKAPHDEYNLAEEDQNAFFAKNPDLYRTEDHTEGVPLALENPFEQIHPIFKEAEETPESIDFQPFTFDDDIIPTKPASDSLSEITSSEPPLNEEIVENEEPQVVVWENIKDENIEIGNDSITQNSFFDEIEEERVFSSPTTETITEIDINPSLEDENLIVNEEKNTSKIDLESAYVTESQAIFLFNQGKNEEAIKIYEQLMARNPLKATYYENQIKVLKGADLDKAKETKISNVSVNGGDNEPNEGMALQFFTQGKTEEAIAIYEQLMAKHPEKSTYFASQIEILKS